MRTTARRTWPLVAALLALSGCATNQLRVESGRGVAASAAVAAAATRAYLDEVDAARIRVGLDIIALDPNCQNGAYFLTSPAIGRLTDPARPLRGWLCAREQPSPTSERAVVGPIAPELAPTLALIDALGDYGAAITDIVDDKQPDPAKDLAEAVKLAEAAEKLLRGGFGGTPLVPAADDKRLGAVLGFIKLVQDIRSDADRAKRLKRLAAETESGALIAALQDHVRIWERARASSANLSRVIAVTVFAASARIDPPLPAQARRDYAASLYAADANLTRGASLAPAIDATLKALSDEDRAFRNALGDPPRLNADQRRRRGELTRARLIAIFDSLTSLITAAKGL